MKPFPTGILVCLSISALMVTTSCRKTTTPDPPPGGGTGATNPPANSNYLSSIRDGKSSQLLDSFTYDNSNRLTKISISYGDTTGIVIGSIRINGTPQESTVTFSYAGNNTVPASYTVVNSSDQKTHLHQLSYDGQNRIIKDSALDNSGFVSTWSYPNGNIVSSIKSGINGGEILDTLYLTNGNVTAQHMYLFGNTERPDTVFNSVATTYSTIVNPNYHQAVANTFGPLFSYLGINGGVSDYISVNALSSATNNSRIFGLDNLPGATATQNYAWTTDGKNRAATLNVSDNKLGELFKLKFSYY